MKYFVSILEFVAVSLLFIAIPCGANNQTDGTSVSGRVHVKSVPPSNRGQSLPRVVAWASSPWGTAKMAVPRDARDTEMPYVYTQWKHFTVKDGLLNDHVFAVKADVSNVWVGSEDGLACIGRLGTRDSHLLFT